MNLLSIKSIAVHPGRDDSFFAMSACSSKSYKKKTEKNCNHTKIRTTQITVNDGATTKQRRKQMISKTRIFILGLICGAMLFLPNARAMGGGPPPPGHPGSGGPLMEAIRSLGLSESQETQMQTIRATYEEQIKTYMDTVFELKNEMMQSLLAEEYDESKVREYLDAISANIEELELLKAKMLVQIKGVLYSEQVEQLQKNLAERIAFMEEQREKRDAIIEKLMEQGAG